MADLKELVTGPVRYFSFDKTDSGFMAKVCFSPKQNIPTVIGEKYIHSENLKDLMEKITKIVLTNGVE